MAPGYQRSSGHKDAAPENWLSRVCRHKRLLIEQLQSSSSSGHLSVMYEQLSKSQIKEAAFQAASFAKSKFPGKNLAFYRVLQNCRMPHLVKNEVLILNGFFIYRDNQTSTYCQS